MDTNAADGAPEDRSDSAATAACVHEAEVAACQLHAAETALHDARQTEVDAWISAAANRLHDAVVHYHDACDALTGRSDGSSGMPVAH
jgi:hypothetical protein